MSRENYVELALGGFNAGLDLGENLITARERLAVRAHRRAADQIGATLGQELKKIDAPVMALKAEMRMFVEEAAIKGEAPDEKKLAEYQRRLVFAEADQANLRADTVFSRMVQHGSNKYAINVLKPLAEAEMERFQQMQQNSRQSEELAFNRQRLESDRAADAARIADNQAGRAWDRESERLNDVRESGQIAQQAEETRKTQREDRAYDLIEQADIDAREEAKKKAPTTEELNSTARTARDLVTDIEKDVWKRAAAANGMGTDSYIAKAQAVVQAALLRGETPDMRRWIDATASARARTAPAAEPPLRTGSFGPEISEVPADGEAPLRSARRQ